jgi:hypothetical protein
MGERERETQKANAALYFDLPYLRKHDGIRQEGVVYLTVMERWISQERLPTSEKSR